MKRLLTVLLLLACLILPVSAGSTCFTDGAGLLTAEQGAEVEEALSRTGERLGMVVAVITENTTDDPDEDAYRLFTREYGEQDGILLFIAMADRDWCVYAQGAGLTAMNGAARQYVADQILPDLSAGNYKEAFLGFARECEAIVSSAEEGETFRAPFRWIPTLPVCFAIALGASLIVVLCMRGKLKTVRARNDAEGYQDMGSLELTDLRDVFVNRTVTRVPVHTDSGGSHGGSGGVSHGSTSGKF